MRFPIFAFPLAVFVGRSSAQSSSLSVSPSASPSPSASHSASASGSSLASASSGASATSVPSASPSISASASGSTIASLSASPSVSASQGGTTSGSFASASTTSVSVSQGPSGSTDITASSSAAPAAGGGGGVNGGAPPVRDPNAIFNYPQPPLPAVSATRNSNSWLLSPKFKITNKPTTREFTFDLTKAAAAPDGYPRQIYAVNNQFPGPLIEANEGDTVVVHMNNYLDIGASIHWHGMYQNGTAFMDGAPGVSQCPIPPGGSFTYRFKIQKQYGSYWWHSHFGNTLADGLTGGLIVHSTRDPIKRGRDFDEEVVVMVQDWMDIQSESIVQALHTNEGYRGGFAPPQGNSILINGLGTTNCTNPDIQDRTAPCSAPAPAEIPVPVGKRVRIRVLNTGSFGMFRVSIDQHPFSLVEVDDTAVWGPKGMHEVQLTTGQRSSIIIKTNQGGVGSGFFFRANFVLACLGAFGGPQSGVAVLRYVDASGNSPNHDMPTSQPWGDLAVNGGDCIDIDEVYDLKPREAVDAPTEILETHVMSSEAGVFVNKNGVKIGNFGINNVAYQNQIGYPLLTQVQEGHEIDGELVAHATFHNMGGGDIVINNLDQPISHPFHLHGKPFMIVARGKGSLTNEQWVGMRDSVAKVHNPLRRDVLEIPGGSYAVLRLYVDLPGVWPLHCHIGWHLSEGKLAAMVYLPDKVKKLSKPAEWTGLCASWGKDEIGPARRALPPVVGERRARKGRRITWTGPREP